jgi:hypothetical protein
MDSGFHCLLTFKYFTDDYIIIIIIIIIIIWNIENACKQLSKRIQQKYSIESPTI